MRNHFVKYIALIVIIYSACLTTSENARAQTERECQVFADNLRDARQEFSSSIARLEQARRELKERVDSALASRMAQVPGQLRDGFSQMQAEAQAALDAFDKIQTERSKNLTQAQRNSEARLDVANRANQECLAIIGRAAVAARTLEAQASEAKAAEAASLQVQAAANAAAAASRQSEATENARAAAARQSEAAEKAREALARQAEAEAVVQSRRSQESIERARADAEIARGERERRELLHVFTFLALGGLAGGFVANAFRWHRGGKFDIFGTITSCLAAALVGVIFVTIGKHQMGAESGFRVPDAAFAGLIGLAWDLIVQRARKEFAKWETSASN